MAPRCAAFGISRKTGYKIFERYKDCGLGAFTDRSRRPYRQANRLPAPLEATIVRLKREYPGWGAPKIRKKLRQQTPGVHLPAISTVHAVLDRHGLVKRRRRRRAAASSTALSRPSRSQVLVGDELWFLGPDALVSESVPDQVGTACASRGVCLRVLGGRLPQPGHQITTPNERSASLPPIRDLTIADPPADGILVAATRGSNRRARHARV